MERISQHISYREATKSRTADRLGIANNPTDEHLENMVATAENIFEPVRVHYGVPIFVSCFYRSPELNKKIKGSSKTSQHMVGQAIDMDADVFEGITNAQIFYHIKENLMFDQLIWEHGTEDNPNWVHCSYKKDGGNRRKILIAYINEEGKLRYKKWDRD